MRCSLTASTTRSWLCLLGGSTTNTNLRSHPPHRIGGEEVTDRMWHCSICPSTFSTEGRVLGHEIDRHKHYRNAAPDVQEAFYSGVLNGAYGTVPSKSEGSTREFLDISLHYLLEGAPQGCSVEGLMDYFAYADEGSVEARGLLDGTR